MQCGSGGRVSHDSRCVTGGGGGVRKGCLKVQLHYSPRRSREVTRFIVSQAKKREAV